MTQHLAGLRDSFACACRHFFPRSTVSRTPLWAGHFPRAISSDSGINTDAGGRESGANDRTKAVGDKTGCMQQRAAWSDLGTVGSSRAETGFAVRRGQGGRLDDSDEFDLEGVWGRFKDRIAGLVGWHRRQGEPLLQTEAAYRTAINWGWKQSRSGIESLPGSRPNSPQPRYPDPELGRLAPHRQPAQSLQTNP